ncbi:hypothetical protein KALB_4491 [Kutzneria albida DSM 43870]|uniref:HTH luxR-type domain-containing protein n=1 Tax=Kutzneria albida DSM 43870 TaxID=1449976 RepID=W5W9P5_9PSEU|nr:hypothetical protein KALB_4491 [Kutzneria albida DSM 43870]
MKVAVIADDPLTADGTVSYLNGFDQVRAYCGAEAAERCQVVVALGGDLSPELLTSLRAAATLARPRRLPALLVVNQIELAQAEQAVHAGVVTVLWRQETSLEQVYEAVLRIQRPNSVQGNLIAQIRGIESRNRELALLRSGALSEREIQLLQLLSEGTPTTVVARVLGYSERSVKGFISDLKARLGLRGRVHAVAYAARHDLLARYRDLNCPPEEAAQFAASRAVTSR